MTKCKKCAMIILSKGITFDETGQQDTKDDETIQDHPTKDNLYER